MQKELDPTKIYQMPNTISIKKIKENYLVISIDTANWLLLTNDKQLSMFNFLSDSYSVQELFNAFPDDLQDILSVLTELEAKKFESLHVNYPQNNGLYIYLTNKCNQQCNHCYMKAGNVFSNELTMDEIKQILKNFSDSGGKVVTFTGGEPTLRTDFIEIVKFAKHCNLKTCILSNGLLWDDQFITSIKSFVDEVQISLDGYDAKSYMDVRNMDGFDIVLKTIDLIVKYNIKIAVAISPSFSSLINNQEKYYNFSKLLTEKYENKDFIVKFSTELFEGRNISTTDEENKLYKKISNTIKQSSRLLSDEEEFALEHEQNTIFNNCGYGGLTVSSTGDIYFCNLIHKCIPQANIRTHTFNEILHLSSNAKKNSDINVLTPCNKCELKYLCGGGCRIKYFPDIITKPIKNSLVNQKISRKISCDQSQKDKIYSLMINSNELFYR